MAEAADGGAADAQGEEDAPQPDDFVEVHGLASERGQLLNGRRGAVLRPADAPGRLEVRLGPSEVTSLKPQNLRRLGETERLQSLRAACLEQLEGEAVRVTVEHLQQEARDRAVYHGRLRLLLEKLCSPICHWHGRSLEALGCFSEGAGGAAEEAEADATTVRMRALLEAFRAFGKLGPSELERGEALEVVDLASEGGRALNGTLVHLLAWDGERQRYRVAPLHDAAQSKALRPENVRRVAEQPFAAGAGARDFQRRLREAYQLPDARSRLKGLLRAPAEGGTLRDVALATERPVLEAFGFRGDPVGQFQVRRAVAAAIEADAGLCQDTAAPLGSSWQAPAEQPGAPDSVVFLDVDGVLHSLYGEDIFRESCCAVLEQILRSTGAAVVLSSTWRTEEAKVEMINDMLRRRRLPAVWDRTRDLGAHRAAEICEWLEAHPEVVRWIAIDDQDLEAHPSESAQRMRGRFVRTDQASGLSLLDAPLAAALLLAQSGELLASHLVRHPLPGGVEALAARLRVQPEGAGAARGLSADERQQLQRLFSACHAGLATFHELAVASGLSPELEGALAERGLSSTAELARLVIAGEYEDRVLGLWFDPGDGGGERTLTDAEADALRLVGKACRREAALLASDGRVLREVAESCGIAPALTSALVEVLEKDRAVLASRTRSKSG